MGLDVQMILLATLDIFMIELEHYDFIAGEIAKSQGAIKLLNNHAGLSVGKSGQFL
jgi:transketolase C-terminal domain/subunit